MADPTGSLPTRPVPEDAPRSARDIRTELFSRFHNFDDPDSYESYMAQAISGSTANFAVRFGVENADIAVNLKEQDLGALLQVQAEAKDDKIVCTWM